MRMSSFVVASGLALCLVPVWGPASAETDAKGFVRLTPDIPGTCLATPGGPGAFSLDEWDCVG